jgi:coenzyme F420-reducing hydrogenase alpha subunit
MKKELNIKVKELTRVEGHGNIVVDVKKGLVKEVRLEIVESPRFFEMMIKGRRYDEVQHIMARICGICATSHSSAALKAIEAAMSIRITPQTKLLRKLAFTGEVLQSHMLHLFFLVLPDYFGVQSVVPLMKSNPELIKAALELKRVSTEICTVTGGRPVHPISLAPGGMLHIPKPEELKILRGSIEKSFTPLRSILQFFKSVPLPDFTSPRELIALKKRGEYSFYDGVATSNKKYRIPAKEYADKIKEFVVPYSTAKQARSPKGTFMVGAMARVNNNFRNLLPQAKKAAKEAGVTAPLENPFLNNIAQLIECFHLFEEAVSLIDTALEKGLKKEPLIKPKPKASGRGVGMVEAPRGTLFHDYTVDAGGIITEANCIIPTATNTHSIEEDMKQFVPTILDKPKAEIQSAVETLVRAYDPCISCSTHIMDVTFI